MTDIKDVVLFIMEAEENELKQVQQAMTLRRSTLREIKALLLASELYVGTRVRLAWNIRPKKIAGKIGTVTEIKHNGKYVVTLDEPVDNWRAPVCEASLLEIL